MSDPVRAAIDELLADHDLTAPQMQAAIGTVMDGDSNEVQLAALLTALRIKGESVDEVAGAAEAMVARATRIPTTRTGLLDTCGTGGDQLSTFNISTVTAIVAAAAGVPVAKHGNRSVSSSSGSADVLEALGVNIELSPERVAACLDEIGIGFCFARLLHGAMKYAAPVRQRLGFRTIFNLLGPLTNPAGAEYQLLGANTVETAEKLASALQRLGRKRAIVVCGAGELDEVALWGDTTAFVLQNGTVERTTWTPDTFGLPNCRVADLCVDGPEESAQAIRDLLEGTPGPCLDIVLANTAAALFTAERVGDLPEGVEIARKTVESGAARELCRRLADWTNT